MDDEELIPPGVSYDDAGRLFSPFIERGADEIPRAVNVPTNAALRGMTTDELAGVANRFGYLDTYEARVQIHSGFLARYNIHPGDPRWEDEMGRLEDNIGRSLLGHTRRLATRHETLTAIGGDTETMMIRIAESDEPCDECEPLAGIEDTYAGFVSSGTMPGDRCLGGGNCLCTLMEIR